MVMLPEEKLRFETVVERVDFLEDKLDTLDTIDKKVDQLMALIVGNKLIGEDTGLIGKLKVLETKLTDFEKLWDKVKYFAMGGLFFSGYGIYQLFKNFILTGIFK